MSKRFNLPIIVFAAAAATAASSCTETRFPTAVDRPSVNSSVAP